MFLIYNIFLLWSPMRSIDAVFALLCLCEDSSSKWTLLAWNLYVIDYLRVRNIRTLVKGEWALATNADTGKHTQLCMRLLMFGYQQPWADMEGKFQHSYLSYDRCMPSSVSLWTVYSSRYVPPAILCVDTVNLRATKAARCWMLWIHLESQSTENFLHDINQKKIY